MSKCKVGSILDDADRDENKELLKALYAVNLHGDFEWSAKALSSAINKTRFKVGATTIKDHRRKACGCF